MLVCWDWLAEYVELSTTPEDLALQFAMSGLNHESTDQVGGDTVLDLEVTSNRGDCLGHVGVAREAAVLLGQTLRLPDPQPPAGDFDSADFIQVKNEFLEGCPEYTARVVRGVRIGPSPDWLVRRLQAVGINSVNNVVDVTNYVMLECGQPLHAFDLKHLQGGQIIVRRASDDEQFLAIDHKTYQLDSHMVVIADAKRSVALGGVMGGAESEVSDDTVDLLIEAARFQPLAIRRAARKLKLHSPSSYRFERSPDPAGLDAASLRCCQLIVELAGGQVGRGLVRAGQPPAARESITFRYGQLPRVLGLDIPSEEVNRILTHLGCETREIDAGSLSVQPPTWRGDLHREIDLIEEVARIHGYDRIPEDVAVPIGVASPRPKDLALDEARRALSAYGIDEAMTASVVDQRLDQTGSLWTSGDALATDTSMLEGARFLRRAIVPSLLVARYNNQTQSIPNAQLYEVANVYLPTDKSSALPSEQCTLGIVVGDDLRLLKGAVEELLEHVVGRRTPLDWQPCSHDMFAAGSGQQVSCGGEQIGFTGLLHPRLQQSFSLNQPVAVAELNVDAFVAQLQPVRQAAAVSAFPAITRDLNFIVDESVRWSQLSDCCQQDGGPHLQRVAYQETYRDAQKDGPGKKRLLLTLHFQSLERTLTGDEVDQSVQQIVASCEQAFQAQLLS